MPKYLVTGGAGFIGSNLVRQLVALQHEVVVLDNLSTGKKSNLKGLARDVIFIKGDIRDAKALTRAMRGVDFVFHEAALTSVPQSIENPALVGEVNVLGTINVLQAAQRARVQRVVFASSSAVYGNHSDGAAHESLLPTPVSPYGVSKLVGEHYCRVMSQLHEMPTVCLRYFNVFGPQQDYRGGYAAVIPTILRQLLKKEAPTIHGRGDQSRDFTYVANVVEANIQAAHSSLMAGEAINIGGGEQITIKELVRQLQKALGTKLSPRFLPRRAGDIHTSFASLTRAEELLGYTPQVPPREGLTLTTAWYQAHT